MRLNSATETVAEKEKQERRKKIGRRRRRRRVSSSLCPAPIYRLSSKVTAEFKASLKARLAELLAGSLICAHHYTL